MSVSIGSHLKIQHSPDMASEVSNRAEYVTLEESSASTSRHVSEPMLVDEESSSSLEMPVLSPVYSTVSSYDEDEELPVPVLIEEKSVFIFKDNGQVKNKAELKYHYADGTSKRKKHSDIVQELLTKIETLEKENNCKNAQIAGLIKSNSSKDDGIVALVGEKKQKDDYIVKLLENSSETLRMLLKKEVMEQLQELNKDNPNQPLEKLGVSIKMEFDSSHLTQRSGSDFLENMPIKQEWEDCTSDDDKYISDDDGTLADGNPVHSGFCSNELQRMNYMWTPFKVPNAEILDKSQSKVDCTKDVYKVDDQTNSCAVQSELKLQSNDAQGSSTKVEGFERIDNEGTTATNLQRLWKQMCPWNFFVKIEQRNE